MWYINHLSFIESSMMTVLVRTKWRHVLSGPTTLTKVMIKSAIVLDALRATGAAKRESIITSLTYALQVKFNLRILFLLDKETINIIFIIFLLKKLGQVCPEKTINPIPCPGGTWSENTKLTSISECLDCPSSYYCPEGSSSKISCDEGYFCPEPKASNVKHIQIFYQT